MFNYSNAFALGSVQTYFLEVGSYVSLKRATAGLWEGRFCWIWLKISQLFKNKNGGVGPKTFTVYLLKRSVLTLRSNIFSYICFLVFEVFQVFRLLHLAAGCQRLTLLELDFPKAGIHYICFDFSNSLSLHPHVLKAKHRIRTLQFGF